MRTEYLKRAVVPAVVAVMAASGLAQAVGFATPEVITFYPHDTDAFTQGLLLHEGEFYESTGLYGFSSLRRVNPITGVVLQQADLDPALFGEGLARVGDRLIQITFQENIANVYDIDTFQRLDSFVYGGQGWGLCYDGDRLVMTNGSSNLFFRDPDTFAVLGQIQVTIDGSPIANLNELACIGNLVYANVWLTDTILRIDPATGVVLTEIDAQGLLTPEEASQANVLNGIAFDPATEHFFLTGKLWPKVFEVSFDFDPYGNGPCTVLGLNEITGVKLAKDGAAGITFSWDLDPFASEYHVNSVTSKQDIPAPGTHRVDVAGGLGVARCDAPDPVATCVDDDAQIDPEPVLYYEVFSACGSLGADEGPP